MAPRKSLRRLLTRPLVVKEIRWQIWSVFGFTGDRRMGDAEDKRGRRRVPLLLRIDHPGAPGFDDAARSLSEGGLFLRTDRPVAVGDRLPLLLSFPGLSEPLELEVEVAWVRAGDPDLPAGAAVRIPTDRPELREQLDRLAHPEGSEPPHRHLYRLLVVEDNDLLVRMYQHALVRLAGAEAAIEVEYARDGVEALARLQRAPPIALVVTDLFMPVMDGFSLVERIRAEPALASTPVVAISAGGGEARSRAVELGVDVYLQKPVMMADILGTVRALLRLGES